LGQFDLGAASQTLLFVFLSSLTGAATLIQARRYGVVRRVMSAPLSTRDVVTGQALGRLAIALLQGTWIMVGSAVLFDVDWGSWLAAFVVLLTFSAVAAAAAMAIGAAVDNEGAAAGVGVGAGLVLGALGGCMTPLEFFPDTLRTVAHVTPHAWAYDAFAEIQRRDGGVVDVLPQVGVLGAMAAVMLVVGSLLLRRSLDRAL
jgi:ABC-2 type transport system permease protein